MITTLLLLLCGALMGGAIGYLVLKAQTAQATVPVTRYNELEAQYQQLRLDEGVLRSLFAEAQRGASRAEALQAALQESANGALAESARREAVQQAHSELANRLAETQALLARAQDDLINLKTSQATLQARAETAEQQLVEQKEFIATVKADMEREFRLIATATLDQNGARLSEQQQSRLLDTLEPFRNQLDAFRKQVDEKFSLEADGRNTLKGELHKMLELNQTISRQTENLTSALTKQTKQQGGYGEDVLETILNNAGMIEGEHYYRQFSTRNEDGARIQPDIVIRRPHGLSIVIDSKVSLTHYVRYCDAALSRDEERALRKEIFQSFKAHIDGLSGKKYDTVEGTADFVLMFTPAENAFTIAANHDPALRHYAFGRNVFVVTPSSLLLVVKMISDLWQKDRVNKEAHEIADRARELYEKACGFLNSFAGVGAALDKAKGEWDTAATRLSGNGGLVRQGEMLRKMLGSKTNKKLPAELVARASVSEGLPLPQATSNEVRD